jgi:hypothetical protein
VTPTTTSQPRGPPAQYVFKSTNRILFFLPLEVQIHMFVCGPIKEKPVSDVHREALVKLFYSFKYATLHNIPQ